MKYSYFFRLSVISRFNFLLAFSILCCVHSSALSASKPSPKVLAVIAHPDDETAFAATLYKITHEMNGIVDVIMITNGEGGYKYSTLAEPIYHMTLTDEEIGRQNLPYIRKMEALNGGEILGIRNYVFLEEKDTGYTKDPHEVLQGSWDTARVKRTLRKLIDKEAYDFVFVLLPVEETHGHHKAATILALETIKESEGHKPVILGAQLANELNEPLNFKGLEDFPITASREHPVARLRKTKKFGYKNQLDYNIIVNWVIAEHKSQGTMQLHMNRSHLENFYYFTINPPSGLDRVKELFNRLEKLAPRSRGVEREVQ